MAGYSEAVLDRLEGEMYAGDFEQAKNKALRYSILVSQGHLDRHDGASIALVREEGLSPVAIREITGAAALGTLVNRVSTMLGTPAKQQMEERMSSWYFDLLYPLLKPLFSGWQRLSTKTPILRADHVTGPLAAWIRPLVGTSLGTLVQNMTTQWLDRPFALPLRTKLLILAVVARGLDCSALESKAYALVDEHTDLSRSKAQAAVAHLGGGAVEKEEAQLLKLARASIRHESDHIRRAARRHTAALSRRETIDAVASVGVTNVIGRLRVLFHLDS